MDLTGDRSQWLSKPPSDRALQLLKVREPKDDSQYHVSPKPEYKPRGKHVRGVWYPTPNQLEVIKLLASNKMSARELSDTLQCSRVTVNNSLRTLRGKGLIYCDIMVHRTDFRYILVGCESAI